MELHKLQVLHGQPRSRSHGASVSSASVGRGAGLVAAAKASCGNDGRVSAKAMDRAILHANGNATNALAILGHDQVQGKVFHEEQAVVLQRHTVQGVKDSVTCAIGSCRTTVRLPTFAKLQTLTTKGALVDRTLRCARKGEPKGLKLQYNLRSKSAHVLNGILISEPISTFHRIIRVPAPIILRHVRQGAVDSTLSCHCV
mmetsp:Transcript_14602/g.33178  ORF Transcript_14602/g.33178 Transcript_14602/m.33178 type:complete len:200 (+) Transcript_14602:1228-1827(+)